jgi:hypothetical protein
VSLLIFVKRSEIGAGRLDQYAARRFADSHGAIIWSHVMTTSGRTIASSKYRCSRFLGAICAPSHTLVRQLTEFDGRREAVFAALVARHGECGGMWEMVSLAGVDNPEMRGPATISVFRAGPIPWTRRRLSTD